MYHGFFVWVAAEFYMHGLLNSHVKTLIVVKSMRACHESKNTVCALMTVSLPEGRELKKSLSTGM